MSRRSWSLWPRSLFARLTLILFAGLVLAHALSFSLVAYERSQATTKLMLGYLERDIVSSVALLERLPAAERGDWLARLERMNYQFILGPGVSGPETDDQHGSLVAQAIANAVGTRYPVHANLLPGFGNRLQVHLQLSDGSPLTIDLRLNSMPLAPWVPLLLLVQLALIAACTWLGVRLATRPLAQLAKAADTLGPDLNPARLPEDGPTEVAHAASAFNAMQDRIATYMHERMQILAAISHDLQTPITRMRLRADTMEQGPHSESLQRDLAEMQALVREGLTYARTLHAAAEVPLRIDPDALLESLAFDYLDAGQDVALQGRIGRALTGRPQALRRIMTNLIDNALKYAGAAEVTLQAGPGGQVTISVLDRGAGIPQDQLEAVFQPFYRLEASRNRESGGTGLGLAIARQLALAMNATLALHNRPGGGLEARLTLAPDS
ncbi:sensor histidine kinase [Janthinobacterium agaricidamnosum]|uniref:histidine kinase n=1 Tax=Janthinobacterium agaricidamnosum NBRC 102515 = DSM 9628 TaxID=1349767 RepID=W0VAY6_9BURK|nr:HAMP domain-containing sensor histidine kinase [Janthinobacterium agaricidamnosum]CDG85949.1 HAMP domain protein [Janthinobacterium agaricidamnosum NBRC 102515 = DSM 9628]